MTPDQARALYRAAKKRTIRKQAVVAVQRAKADTRVRKLIERVQDGESHTAIAADIGVARCTVSQAISRYRRRHPDCRPSSPGAAGVAAPLNSNPTTFNVFNLLHELEATS